MASSFPSAARRRSGGVVAVDEAGRLPAPDADFQQPPRLDQRAQVPLGEPRPGAEVVMDPARLRHAERPHRLLDHRQPRLGLVRWRPARRGRQHPFREVVDPLELLAPRHHQLAERQPRLQPLLLPLPAPPPGVARPLAREVRGLDRPSPTDLFEQSRHPLPLVGEGSPGPADGPVLARRQQTPVQPVVLDRRQARLVGPGLEDRPPGKQLVEPLGLVVPQPGVQDEMVASGDDVDGVELQQRHPADGGQHVLGSGHPGRPREQPLGREVDQPDLGSGEGR